MATKSLKDYKQEILNNLKDKKHLPQTFIDSVLAGDVYGADHLNHRYITDVKFKYGLNGVADSYITVGVLQRKPHLPVIHYVIETVEDVKKDGSEFHIFYNTTNEIDFLPVTPYSIPTGSTAGGSSATDDVVAALKKDAEFLASVKGDVVTQIKADNTFTIPQNLTNELAKYTKTEDLNKTYATKTSVTDVTNNLAKKADSSALSAYLTKTDASSTYLTKNEASTTYQPKATK